MTGIPQCTLPMYVVVYILFGLATCLEEFNLGILIGITFTIKCSAFIRCLLSKVTYNKYICQKKEKQYILVGIVMMFIEPSATAKH